MTIAITPLHACISKHSGELADVNYKKATAAQLSHLLTTAGSMMITKPGKVDLARAVIWFVCAEYSRRGIAPRYREPLGLPPYHVRTLLDAVRKGDAPYLDMQWLAIHYPAQSLPKTWLPLMTLPGNLVPSGVPERKRRKWDDDPFGALERIVFRSSHVGVKCRLLHLTHEQQVGMRFYCTKAIRERIVKTNLDSAEILERIERQRIPQLQLHFGLKANRVRYWKAWRLAGGGNNWAGTARIFGFMTGKPVSRQAAKAMIGTMAQQKIARRRKRKRVLKPVL